MAVYDINRILVPDAPPEYEDHTRDVHYVPAPCQVACPIGTDAPFYIAHIWDENYEAAFEAITSTNPFSSICGRVCDAPCEPACRRVDSDGAVQIRNLKRFVMDKLGATWRPSAAPVTRSQSIGIVGAGPAGLVAAHDLCVAGYAVHVYEMTDRLGGMMIWGIPAFRLPPGLGGQLMAKKVTPELARIRGIPHGIDLRSPSRHPDILGGDDLLIKVEEMREATGYRLPVSVKLGAGRVSDDVKIAVKDGFDFIEFDGMQGSTGAGSAEVIDYVGVPTLPDRAVRDRYRDPGPRAREALRPGGGVAQHPSIPRGGRWQIAALTHALVYTDFRALNRDDLVALAPEAAEITGLPHEPGVSDPGHCRRHRHPARGDTGGVTGSSRPFRKGSPGDRGGLRAARQPSCRPPRRTGCRRRSGGSVPAVPLRHHREPHHGLSKGMVANAFRRLRAASNADPARRGGVIWWGGQ